MPLGHRILVPLDGSEIAERVLPVATAIAKHTGGSLHLVRVHGEWLPMMDPPPSAGGIVAEAEREARDAGQLYIERMLESLRDGAVSATAAFRVGQPHEEILKAAEKEDADLIAMATHGRGGFDRLWVGSVADRVARQAHVPVLLVSAGDRAEGARDDRAVTPETAEIHTVIVALDGSAFAEEALAPATALGEVFSADYLLYRSITSTGLTPYPPPENALVADPEALEAERATARGRMEKTAEGLRNAGHSVTLTIDEEEDPARGVVRLAAQTPGSVIAMTTHGRGGLRRAILGSVADKVVRASTAPVLLIRPERAEK